MSICTMHGITFSATSSMAMSRFCIVWLPGDFPACLAVFCCATAATVKLRVTARNMKLSARWSTATANLERAVASMKLSSLKRHNILYKAAQESSNGL